MKTHLYSATLLCLLYALILACKSPDPIVVKSTEKSITAFSFASPAVTAAISGNSITGTLPLGTLASSLVPTITVSAKATVSPASGVAQDFTKPVLYKVTAEDGSSQTYTATMSINKSSAKAILTFAFASLSPSVTATIDNTARTISATVAAGTDVTKLTPTLTLSDKTTVSPASGVVQDFSKAITYTVTAEDGSSQAYVATVTVALPVNNGTVYIGNLDGILYALDALTGSKKWEFQASDAITSTPTVVNGLVYFASWDRKLYALDATTGTKKWEFIISTSTIHPTGAPMVANGLVYYGGDPYLYALDALTGILKWQYQGSPLRIVESSPTTVDGVVYAVIRGFGNPVHALDALTGALKWKSAYTDGTEVLSSLSESSPAVTNSLVYIGSEGDGVTAFDVKTGAFKWRFAEASVANSSPTVANGIMYIGSGVFGTNNKKLYALDATTGVKKWEYVTETSTAGFSSPIVSAGVVYIGAGSTLYAVDAATGAQKWTAQPETSTLIYSGPVVATGLVYLGIGKKMYAFDAASGIKKWEFETSRRIDASSPCVVAKDGTVYHAGVSGMVQ